MTRLFEAKPFIIAEVGSNWGTLNDCVQSIGAAAACGANAAKFQAFDWDSLYGVAFDETNPVFWEVNEEHRLPIDWLPALKEKADACRIELMCTAFSPELVAAVDPFVSVHKVASSDLSYPQLLQAVAKTGKPILLSTGASGLFDIHTALSVLGHQVSLRTVLMYCISAYPARTIDLEAMRALREGCSYPVGFSDHSIDIIGHPIEAARRGAVAIEKHFTAFPELQSPDRPHSLTASEFKLMVDYIRLQAPGRVCATFEESDMFLRHNRRLLATRDVGAGEALRYGQNFGAYRSLVDDTRGLSPFAWEQVEGRVATKPIQRGAGIGPGDFQ